MDPFYLVRAPRNEIFARQNGATLEPLLLGLPQDVLAEILAYVNIQELGRLFNIGSPLLTAFLRRPSAIREITVPFGNIGISRCKSLVATYTQLQSIEIHVKQPKTHGWSTWRISNFPPTLTRLCLNVKRAFRFFVASFGSADVDAHDGDDDMIDNILRHAQRLEWLNTRAHLPRLCSLNMSSNELSTALYPAWLATLPETLEDLRVNLHTLAGVDDPAASCGRLFPPLLRTLSAPPQRWSIMRFAMNDFPKTLTALNIALYWVSADFLMRPDVATHLRQLRVRYIARGGRENSNKFSGNIESILPRSLTHLCVATDENDQPDLCMTHLAISQLPRSITHLEIPTRKFAPHFGALPPNLRYLKYEHAEVQNRHYAYRPRHLSPTPLLSLLPSTVEELELPKILVLREWDANFGVDRDPMSIFIGANVEDPNWCTARVSPPGAEFASSPTSEFLPGLPSRLTRFSAHIRLVDSDLRHFPKSIQMIDVSDWISTGYFLLPTITEVTAHALFTSAANVSVIKASACEFEGPLVHLPPATTSIHNLNCSHLDFTRLPKPLKRIPASIRIADGPETDFFRERSNLERFAARGVFRLSQWLNLPPTIKFVRDGAVLLEDADVCDALARIGENFEKSQQTDFKWPDNLIDVATKKLKSVLPNCGGMVAQRRDWHAPIRAAHFSQLPRGITRLDLRLLHPEHIPSYADCKVDELLRNQPAEPKIEFSELLTAPRLPSSITDLEVSITHEPHSHILVPYQTLEHAPSALRIGALSPATLPAALTTLRVYGMLHIGELAALGAATRLQHLTVREIGGTNFEPENAVLSRAIAALPTSLQSLRIIRNPLHPSYATHLPRALQTLELDSPLETCVSAFTALPPELKCFVMHTKAPLPHAPGKGLPGTLTNLTINRKRLIWKVNGKIAPKCAPP